MKKILLILLLLTAFAFSQQINHTWGYTTAGVAWNQTGSADLDSNGTVTIVLDLQDYYYVDWFPTIVTDVMTITGSSSDTVGVDSIYGSSTQTVYSNSTRLYYGTFWYRWDLQNATDSVYYTIKAYPGNWIYSDGGTSRISTTNLNFSTTATTLVDTTSGTYTTNDIQWTAVNVYVGSVTKVLPPEFIKIVMDLEGVSCDSIDAYWDYAYPGLPEYDQGQRSYSLPRKSIRSLK